MEIYGKELVMDFEGCDTDKFTRESIDQYFTELCEKIEMEKCDVHFWDDLHTLEEEKQTNPKTKGTSAVCFILTSTIVIHTLDLTGEIFVNVFSCKEFNMQDAFEFTSLWFNGCEAKTYHLERGARCRRK